MKKKFKFLCLLLSMVFAFSLGITACTGSTGGVSTKPQTSNSSEDGENSSVAPSSSSAQASSSINQGGDDDDDDSSASGKNVVKFWYSGEEAEQDVFTSLVKTFNDTIGATDNIYVDAKPVDNVDTAIGNRFLTAQCPDVFYVGDGTYKKYVEADYLLDITNYVNNSTLANPDNMWGSIRDRYFYSTTNHRGGDDADENGAWYGLPKDIGPTVIYYNETMFRNAGVTVISVAEENLEDFNLDTEFLDDRGHNKEYYGINDDVPEKGYFVLDGQKYFNNQIAMSWDEVRDLATVINLSEKAINPNVTVYGYHTEWWFAYGWSVGGDCIEYVDAQDYNTYDGGGFYDFTLVDDTKNYMAKETIKVGENTYEAGEVVSYQDKLQNEVSLAGKNNKHATAVYASEITNNPSKFTELPSQREAFVEFVLLSTDSDVTIEGKNGYNVCPKPTSLGGDGAKTATFKNKQLGMLVDGRWNVTDFRKTVDFEWDVAPLPVYKTYNSDGTVKAKGLESGHSGSVALAINGYLKGNPAQAERAWKFVEFLAGEQGQREQSLAGFAIPSQVELASNPNNGLYGGGVFVNQKDAQGNLLRPYNAKIFLRAAANEHEGDWAYTKTGSAWIDGWAGLLNGQVRNGAMTFEEFMADNVFMATYNSLKDLTRKTTV